jgi:hypothetical protein
MLQMCHFTSFVEVYNIMPIPVAAQSKAWVCGRSRAWDCGFRSHRGHGCLSVLSVVCCQVEVSAWGWSPVQRSPTECAECLIVIVKPR